MGGLTFTSGQQPHSPVSSLQQVVPDAQLLALSHFTSPSMPRCTALSLENQGRHWSPAAARGLVQEAVRASQV